MLLFTSNWLLNFLLIRFPMTIKQCWSTWYNNIIVFRHTYCTCIYYSLTMKEMAMEYFPRNYHDIMWLYDDIDLGWHWHLVHFVGGIVPLVWWSCYWFDYISFALNSVFIRKEVFCTHSRNSNCIWQLQNAKDKK